MSDILSFDNSEGFEFQGYEELEPGSDLDKLIKATIAQVKKDGLDSEAILPHQSEATVLQNAAGMMFYDVSEFYNWYFEDDPRSEFIRNQKPVEVDPKLFDIVNPIVLKALPEMREVGDIPVDQDSDTISYTITNNLCRYIQNWQDWYYERKQEDDEEDYGLRRSYYEDVYVDSDYGDLTNLDNYLMDDVEYPFADD